MSQIPELLQTLKRELKTHGLTYAKAASHLSLSENSIKRLFSSKNCSLDRLEQLCELVDIDVIELAKKTESAKFRVDRLSDEQEQEIASDERLLLIATCVLNHWTFDEILTHYTISEHDCIQLMAKLDRLKIIEMLPLNRFKLIVAKNFRWRTNGPIHRYFNRIVQPQFFNSDFSESGEKLLFQSGMLSPNSNRNMVEKMEKLLVEFRELNDRDTSLPIEQRFGTSVCLAIRPWELDSFKALRKHDKKQMF